MSAATRIRRCPYCSDDALARGVDGLPTSDAAEGLVGVCSPSGVAPEEVPPAIARSIQW